MAAQRPPAKRAARNWVPTRVPLQLFATGLKVAEMLPEPGSGAARSAWGEGALEDI